MQLLKEPSHIQVITMIPIHHAHRTPTNEHQPDQHPGAENRKKRWIGGSDDITQPTRPQRPKQLRRFKQFFL